jgi:aarF domain-containing kinase
MWRSLTAIAKSIAKPRKNASMFNKKVSFRSNSTQTAPKKRSVAKIFGYTLGGLTAASGAGILAGSLYADMSVPVFTKHSVRFLRTAYVGTLISLDYKWSLRDIERKDPRYMPIVNEVNLRTAKRLLELCYANRGIYVKAGQHLASLNQVLPKEFTDTLAVLQDKAQSQPLWTVEQVFRQDFNKLPNEMFATFDPVPIAAASLAQVHAATLPDGRKCAVKVQYPDIWDMFRGDIKTIEFMVHTIAFLFPDFQFSWIVPEFKEFLTEELDFINEGKNAEKIQKFFPHNKQIQIPKIYWSYSTKRVLTMEFCDGVKINDVQGIENMKLDKAEVAKLLIDLFSEQIFVHGFVHSDPHPGNILVAPLDPNWRTSTKKNLKPKIMLLDHGLYKTLPNELRVDYCELWRALILRDTKNIEHYAKKLGAGEYWNLLALVLTFRPVGK